MNATDQLTEKLIEWAKFACEDTRAKVGFPDPKDEEKYIPTWLPELEAAINDYEANQ